MRPMSESAEIPAAGDDTPGTPVTPELSHESGAPEPATTETAEAATTGASSESASPEPDAATTSEPAVEVETSADPVAIEEVPSPAPIPMPRPMPRMPAPPLRRVPTLAAAAAEPPADQAALAAAGGEWGRIDDEGLVYLTTSDGERQIGSWQAGERDAGLAHFARRFDELQTEVQLLEARLESGAGDAKATRTQAKALLDQLPTASVLGDVAGLEARLNTVLEVAKAKAAEQSAARDQARKDALAAKEALVLEAEKIAETGSQWKASGDRLRTIVDEWKEIRGADRKAEEVLWKRFAAARDAFGRRRGAHFATLSTERNEAKAAKEKLIAQAEKLAQSSDWRETADALKALMTDWKDAPRGGRDEEDALWARFRAAQDVFFARRSEVFAERDAEQTTNQKLKEDIIAEAEKLSLSNPKSAQTALRGLQDRFDEVGHVPRDAIRRLDDRMKAAEQRIRDAVESEWRTSSPTSNPFLAALLARLAEAETKLAKAIASGDPARIAKAEADVAQRKSLIPAH
jgi:hypothetical protein